MFLLGGIAMENSTNDPKQERLFALWATITTMVKADKRSLSYVFDELYRALQVFNGIVDRPREEEAVLTFDFYTALNRIYALVVLGSPEAIDRALDALQAILKGVPVVCMEFDDWCFCFVGSSEDAIKAYAARVRPSCNVESGRVVLQEELRKWYVDTSKLRSHWWEQDIGLIKSGFRSCRQLDCSCW